MAQDQNRNLDLEIQKGHENKEESPASRIVGDIIKVSQNMDEMKKILNSANGKEREEIVDRIKTKIKEENGKSKESGKLDDVSLKNLSSLIGLNPEEQDKGEENETSANASPHVKSGLLIGGSSKGRE